MKKKYAILVSTIMICGLAIVYATFTQVLTVKVNGTVSTTWGPVTSGCSCSWAANLPVSPNAHNPSPYCTFSGTTGTIWTYGVASSTGTVGVCTFYYKNNGTGLIMAAPTFAPVAPSTTNFKLIIGAGTCLQPGSTGSFKVSVIYSPAAAITSLGVIQSLSFNTIFTQAATC